MLVDISSTLPSKRQLPSAPKRPRLGGADLIEKQVLQDAKQSTCVTIFTAQGDHIIAGTNKGWLNIIDVDSCETRHSTRLCSGIILLLRLTASGRNMVANASDRVIRTIPIPDFGHPSLDIDNINLEVEHRFQDVINRLSWNHVAFSSTGDYVAASAVMNHDIYVWERGKGSLEMILKDPGEELGVVEVRALISAEGEPDLMWDSGIPTVLLWQHVVWKRGVSTSGRLLILSGGRHLHRTSRKWKKTLSMWSEKTSLISIQSKRYINDVWTLRMRLSMY